MRSHFFLVDIFPKPFFRTTREMRDISEHSISHDLFDDVSTPHSRMLQIGEGAFVLRGFALLHVDKLLAGLKEVEEQSPFRIMTTPTGFKMSVELTSAGRLGWTSSHFGYRYADVDPLTNRKWPDIPQAFLDVVEKASELTGFGGFRPDTCLINRYHPGSKLSLHQDKHERRFEDPVVTISLGVSAIFQFGGFTRADKAMRTWLHHGDVVVFGGPDRLRFHGVLPLAHDEHRQLGLNRVSLTFRTA